MLIHTRAILNTLFNPYAGHLNHPYECDENRMAQAPCDFGLRQTLDLMHDALVL